MIKTRALIGTISLLHEVAQASQLLSVEDGEVPFSGGDHCCQLYEKADF